MTNTDDRLALSDEDLHRLECCISCGVPFKETQPEPSLCWYCKRQPDDMRQKPKEPKPMPEFPQEGWASITEVSDIMLVSQATIRSWIDRREISTHKFPVRGTLVNLHQCKEYYWQWIHFPQTKAARTRKTKR